MAADPEPDPKELPRIPHTPAKDARKTLTVKEGYDLQLAAAEPLVADPIAMSFDAMGRLYVVEMTATPSIKMRMLAESDFWKMLIEMGSLRKAAFLPKALPGPPQ